MDRTGRTKSKRTKKVIKCVREQIRQNPICRQLDLAKDHMSGISMRNLLDRI